MSLIPRRLKTPAAKDVALAIAVTAAAVGATYAAIKDPTGTGPACYVTPMGAGACALKRHADQLAKPAP